MIDMRNKIARLQFTQCTEGKRLVFIIGLFDLVLMIALKDLVIGIANQLQIIINKSFMNGNGDRGKNNFCFKVCENAVQPFQLFWIIGKDE